MTAELRLHARGVQEAYAYVPESVPFPHVRDCETHAEPRGDVGVSVASTELPCATMPPFHEHDAAAA